METLLLILIAWGLGKILGMSKTKGRTTQKPQRVPVPNQEEIQRRSQELEARYGQPILDKAPLAPEPLVGGPGSLLQPMEGEDPCHEELFEEEAVIPEGVSAPQMQWNWKLDQQQLVQAVVMQEILTRPCQRQRRGRP